MKHKEINQIKDPNLKAIMKLIKKLEGNQKKLHKVIKNINNDTTTNE